MLRRIEKTQAIKSEMGQHWEIWSPEHGKLSGDWRGQ